MTKDEGRTMGTDAHSSFVARPRSAAEGVGPSSIHLVDTHCHLGWHAFDADRDAVIRRAVEAGVARMVTVGIDVPSSRGAIELADRYAAVYAAVGVHPNDAANFDESALAELRILAQHPRVVAIGEIGLDNHWKTVAPDAQARAFEAQLDLAANVGKPVIVHNRDATEALMAMLTRKFTHHAPRFTSGILHSFSDSLAVAQRAFELGLLIGLSGPITFKKSRDLRELVQAVPPDRFVVETDAPFLAPEPRRGRRNEPAYVRHIAECIAQARGVSVSDIAGQTTANAARLFGWTKL